MRVLIVEDEPAVRQGLEVLLAAWGAAIVSLDQFTVSLADLRQAWSATLPAAQLAEADAKVLQGCYDCLLDARATYERLAHGRLADSAASNWSALLPIVWPEWAWCARSRFRRCSRI